MVDFGESDKMMWINQNNRFSGNILFVCFLFTELLQTKHFMGFSPFVYLFLQL